MNTKPAQPGDILMVRTNHFVSKLIRFGQRAYGKDAAQWNHVAIVVAPEDSEGNGRIVEALTNGICLSPLSKYPEKDVRLISPIPKAYGGKAYGERLSDIDHVLRANAANFAESCVGEKYGFLTILAIAIKTLTKGKLDFNVQGTNICSGLAARSLERMGYNFNPYDPAEITPAYLDLVLSS